MDLATRANDFLKSIEEFNAEKKPAPVPVLNLSFSPEKFFPVKEKKMREEWIGFIEWFYLQNKRLPGEGEFKENFGSEIPENFQEFFTDIAPDLLKRGIKPYETPIDYLEPQFVLAVNMITDPLDRTPIAGKLKRCGLNTRQWKNFLLQPKYQKYYEKAVDEIFDKQTRVSAKIALQSLVEAKDLQAIKYYEERQDIYRPQQQMANEIVEQTLIRLFEILAKFVTPDVLQKIAGEFSKVHAIEAQAS